MLDGKFFIGLAKDVVPMFRKHTFMDALDVKGKKFKRYSTYPSKWASMGMKKSARGLIPKGGISYAEAKKTGQMKRQATEFANSTAPVLSSDLLRDYKLVKITSSGFQFGFPTQGGKVINLAKMGRVISSEADPIPKKLDKFVMKQADKYVNKRLGKIKGRTFNI